MSTRYGKRQLMLRELGYSDFKAGLPISSFYDKHNLRKEGERGAYEIGWRCAKEESREKK